MDSLGARLRSTQHHNSLTTADVEKRYSPATVAAAIDDTRAGFCSRATHLRLGFGIVKLIQEFLTAEGYKGLGWNNEREGVAVLDVFVDVLRGTFDPEIKALGGIVRYGGFPVEFSKRISFNDHRKLRMNQLTDLLEKLDAYFNSMPTELHRGEVAREKIVLLLNGLRHLDDSHVLEADVQMKNTFADWLVGYLKLVLIRSPCHFMLLNNPPEALWCRWRKRPSGTFGTPVGHSSHQM